MFSVQFYVNFLTIFYNLIKKIFLHFSHYQSLFQDRDPKANYEQQHRMKLLQSK